MNATTDREKQNRSIEQKEDERDYVGGEQILSKMGVRDMRLITNNPVKRTGLEGFGLRVVENVPIEIAPNEYNRAYLHTKRARMGHDLHQS